MSADMLLYLFAFVLQAALLGIIMYQLISLSDLENDFINPHDASASVNTWVVPEYAIQAALTAVLLLSGKWIMAAVNIPVLAFNIHSLVRGQHKTDVTEIFRQLPRERRIRMYKLAAYMVSFIFIIYRLVEVAVHTLMTEEGRKKAAKLMREVTADM